MKRVLSSLPTILPPVWDQPFFVNPSVGSDSLGAILLQKDPKRLDEACVFCKPSDEDNRKGVHPGGKNGFGSHVCHPKVSFLSIA